MLIMQLAYDLQLQTGESRWTVIIGEATCTKAKMEGKKKLLYFPKEFEWKAEIEFKV